MNRVSSNSPEEHRTIRLSLAVGSFLLIADQASKLLIQKMLSAQAVTVIPGFFNIVKVNNTGAAWGMFSEFPHALLLISAIAFAAILFYARKIAEGWPERYYALGLILSGIIGNSVDRVWRGSVFDFLDFYIPLIKYHWPAFNVADSVICIGVFIFVFSSLLRPGEDDGSADGTGNGEE